LVVTALVTGPNNTLLHLMHCWLTAMLSCVLAMTSYILLRLTLQRYSMIHDFVGACGASMRAQKIGNDSSCYCMMHGFVGACGASREHRGDLGSFFM